MSAPLVLVLVVAAAYLAAHVAFGWLARRFLIISAAEYLVLGILLGPQVSGMLDERLINSLAPVLTLALGWIGAIVGTQFELRQLLEIPARRFRIAVSESLITFAVVSGLEFAALRWTIAPTDRMALEAALVLGSIATASSSVGIAVISRMFDTRGGVIEQLELSTAINGLIAIAGFGLLLCIWHTPAPASRPLTTTEWAVVSVALGVIGGALFHVFLGETPDVDRLFIALAGGVVLVSGAAAYVRVSPLLSAMFFGITLVNSTSDPEQLISALKRVEQPFYYVLLLFAGASWKPSHYAWAAPVALFLVARIAGKIGGSRLAARANGSIAELGPDWGVGLIGQGRLALAIGLNVLFRDEAFYPNLIFTIVIVSILATEFFSARFARAATKGVGGPRTSARGSLEKTDAAPLAAVSAAPHPSSPGR